MKKERWLIDDPDEALKLLANGLTLCYDAYKEYYFAGVYEIAHSAVSTLLKRGDLHELRGYNGPIRNALLGWKVSERGRNRTRQQCLVAKQRRKAESRAARMTWQQNHKSEAK